MGKADPRGSTEVYHGARRANNVTGATRMLSRFLGLRLEPPHSPDPEEDQVPPPTTRPGRGWTRGRTGIGRAVDGSTVSSVDRRRTTGIVGGVLRAGYSWQAEMTGKRHHQRLETRVISSWGQRTQAGGATFVAFQAAPQVRSVQVGVVVPVFPPLIPCDVFHMMRIPKVSPRAMPHFVTRLPQHNPYPNPLQV